MSKSPSKEINVGSHQWQKGNTKNCVVPHQRQSSAKSSLEVNLRLLFKLSLINVKADSILIFFLWFPRCLCFLLFYPLRLVTSVIIGDVNYRVGLSQQKIDVMLLAKSFSNSVCTSIFCKRGVHPSYLPLGGYTVTTD